MEFIDLIPNICEGFPFNKGDLVLLNFWGDDEDLTIINLISEELSKKGVFSFKHQCSNYFFEKIVLNSICNNQSFSQEYLEHLSLFKNVIDVFMYTPNLPNGISESEIPKFKEFLAGLFNSLTKDKKYYIQLTVPTESNARNLGLDYNVYNSSLCNALSVDFPSLKKDCKDKVESLKHINNITIKTGKEHLLKLNISGRKWFVDDGCGDFPPGEVYIAPIENNSKGELLIPAINLNKKTYENVLLTFENGILTKSSSKEIDVFLHSLPEKFKILCEFGIGLNPQIKELIGFTPIDEKALGTYHIAIGMNQFFGGENNCPFHMDFVFTCDDIAFS